MSLTKLFLQILWWKHIFFWRVNNFQFIEKFFSTSLLNDSSSISESSISIKTGKKNEKKR